MGILGLVWSGPGAILLVHVIRLGAASSIPRSGQQRRLEAWQEEEGQQEEEQRDEERDRE